MSKMTMAEALEFASPEYRVILRKMMDAAGISDTDPADHVISRLGSNKLNTRDEMLAIVSMMPIYRQKYAPRLTQAQRCEILALHHAGFSRETLAKMYKIDRRTVTHIYNPASPHYKSIRDYRNGIGKDKFAEIYLTDHVVHDAMNYHEDVDKTKNNKFGNRKQGLHVVRGPHCNYDHRVIIQWLEADKDNVPVSGWYYRDLDSLFPDNWLSCGEDSLKNSQACFSAMLGEIVDEI